MTLKEIDTTSESTDFSNITIWTYQLAKKYAIEVLVPAGVTSQRKFHRYRKIHSIPPNYPNHPETFYKKNGAWEGWREFLGNCINGNMGEYMSYEKAKSTVQKAGIKSSLQLRKWKWRPRTIPTHPEQQYADEWISWEEFFGPRTEKKKGHLKNAKLKVNEVRMIKQQLQLGVPSAQLAKFFGVSDMQIFRIKSGENWGHIEV